MHLFLSADASETELSSEVSQLFPGAPIQWPKPALLETDFEVTPAARLPILVFGRQWLPFVRLVAIESIRGWANEVFEAVVNVVPEDKPWQLHVVPHYGARSVRRIGARAWHTATRKPHSAKPLRQQPLETNQQVMDADAGKHRCELIRSALLDLLQKKRRHLLRNLRRDPVPFTADDSLVQLLLTAPDSGYVSVAVAPLPAKQRHWLSPFPKGETPDFTDKAAPSRAFAKLVEAELRLGRSIQARETCVDLGAAPGSWTYVAVKRGAQVIAVDRSPLREDLARHPRIQFCSTDAFRFEPEQPVDWLLCDVIAAPERSAALLLNWLRRGWCRHFVVTLKLLDESGPAALDTLKQELPRHAAECFLTRLCANKKEVCAFGYQEPRGI
jgi:23S rRNA (cytidine2498-2'-O)-methyltransferase